MDLPFQTLDVFTDRPFGGNPLGVFPDAAYLATDLMQRIAREMNLSETVFLGPPETDGGTARVRIFTPAVEVPFAGHPTVGTAIFLADRDAGGSEGLRSERTRSERARSERTRSERTRSERTRSERARSERAGSDGERSLVLEENVGPVPVRVRMEDGRAAFAQFTTALLPEHRPSPHSPSELARMVGLEPGDVSTDGLAPEMVSCGLPYFVIPIRSVEAVARATLDMALWRSMLADAWAHHVYLICMDGEGSGVDVHVRMFAPGSGVPEDPATGSAAAALGGYLSRADGCTSGRLAWTVEQGLEMGRPSLIYVEADRAESRTTAVRVGGSAVAVSSGSMRVPG